MIFRSSTESLGTRTSLPCESATTRTSPSSRSSRPETTRPSLRARVVRRNVWSTFRLGSRTSSRIRSTPAQADAVELRADLRPLAAELVARGAVRLEDLGPRGGVRLRPHEAGAAGGDQDVDLLVGRGQSVQQLREPIGKVRNARIAERPGDAVLLEQPGRRLARGHRVEQRLGPGLSRRQGRGDRRLEPLRGRRQGGDQRGLRLGLTGRRQQRRRAVAERERPRRGRSGRASSTGRRRLRVDRRQRRQRFEPLALGRRVSRSPARRADPGAGEPERAGEVDPRQDLVCGSRSRAALRQRHGELARVVVQADSALLQPLLKRLERSTCPSRPPTCFDASGFEARKSR